MLCPPRVDAPVQAKREEIEVGLDSVKTASKQRLWAERSPAASSVGVISHGKSDSATYGGPSAASESDVRSVRPCNGSLTAYSNHVDGRRQTLRYCTAAKQPVKPVLGKRPAEDSLSRDGLEQAKKPRYSKTAGAQAPAHRSSAARRRRPCRATKQPGKPVLGKRPAEDSLSRDGLEQAKKPRYLRTADAQAPAHSSSAARDSKTFNSDEKATAHSSSAIDHCMSVAPQGSSDVTWPAPSSPLEQYAGGMPISKPQRSRAPQDMDCEPNSLRNVEAVLHLQRAAVSDYICPQPLANPGDEHVVPSMDIVTFTALLEGTGLMRDDEVRPLSK